MGAGTEVISTIFTIMIVHYLYQLGLYIARRIEDVYDIKVLDSDSENLLRKIINKVVLMFLKK